jgi:DNA-binding IclR family transcriptional regulator
VKSPVSENEAATVESEPPVRAIDRAARLLKAIAQHGIEGAMLVDLAKETELGRATTHRLLAALSDVGFVFQDPSSRRYRLGHSFAMLSGRAITQEIAGLAQSALERVAEETGDTVYVSAPEGPAAICLGRAIGAFPIRTLTLNLGDRRPLGVGAGSLALLAAMDDAQVDKAIDRNRDWLKAYPGYTPDVVWKLVRTARRLGYVHNQGRVVAGMNSVGVAVLDAQGQPLASLSVAAITERVTGARVEMLVGLLRREAKELARLLAL